MRVFENSDYIISKITIISRAKSKMTQVPNKSSGALWCVCEFLKKITFKNNDYQHDNEQDHIKDTWQE